jgi:hypothetical protein
MRDALLSSATTRVVSFIIFRATTGCAKWKHYGVKREFSFGDRESEIQTSSCTALDRPGAMSVATTTTVIASVPSRIHDIEAHVEHGRCPTPKFSVVCLGDLIALQSANKLSFFFLCKILLSKHDCDRCPCSLPVTQRTTAGSGSSKTSFAARNPVLR